MDFSLLLLATPMTPPTGPAPGVPIGEIPRGVPPAGAAVPGFGTPALPRGPDPGDVGCVPGVAAPGAPAPGAPCPASSGWKSPPVIGSLNFFRRKRCSTS